MNSHSTIPLWPELIAGLRSSGLTQSEIAALVGTTQPTISDLQTGRTTNPSFDLGDKLRRLYEERARMVRAEALDAKGV